MAQSADNRKMAAVISGPNPVDSGGVRQRTPGLLRPITPRHAARPRPSQRRRREAVGPPFQPTIRRYRGKMERRLGLPFHRSR